MALNIARDFYRDERLVLKSLVFTVEDYESVVEREKKLRASDGRTALIVWDDFGLHFSTYRWFSPLQRQKVIDFIENFQSVREEVAVLIATVVAPEMIPPKLRDDVNVLVQAKRRGYGIVVGYERTLWEKIWNKKYDIEWGPAPSSIYSRYRELKRLAHKARRKARVVSLSRIVEAYSKVLIDLYERGELDLETLYGLGILDKEGRVTRFGHLVLKRAGLEPEELLGR